MYLEILRYLIATTACSVHAVGAPEVGPDVAHARSAHPFLALRSFRQRRGRLCTLFESACSLTEGDEDAIPRTR
jgi:hypothetical protein